MIQLKEIRLRKGLTQEQVAQQLRISRASYTNIENGKRDPDTQTLQTLSDLFNVTVDELLGRSNPRAQTSVDISANRTKLTPTEKKLVEDFRSINQQGREYVLQSMAMAVRIYISGKPGAVPDLENQAK